MDNGHLTRRVIMDKLRLTPGQLKFTLHKLGIHPHSLGENGTGYYTESDMERIKAYRATMRRRGRGGTPIKGETREQVSIISDIPYTSISHWITMANIEPVGHMQDPDRKKYCKLTIYPLGTGEHIRRLRAHRLENPTRKRRKKRTAPPAPAYVQPADKCDCDQRHGRIGGWCWPCFMATHTPYSTRGWV